MGTLAGRAVTGRGLQGEVLTGRVLGSGGGAGPWTPASLPGLHTWLRRSTLTASTPIDAWANAGTGADYTSSGTSRPTASADTPPVANFDGADDYALCGTLPPVDGFAVSFVASITDGVLISTTDGTRAGFSLRYASAFDRIRLTVSGVGGGFSFNGDTPNSSVAAGLRSVYVEKPAGALWRIWVDGTELAWIATTAAIAEPQSGVMLGVEWGGFINWFDGSMGDVIIADAPSASDRTEWFSYLSTERSEYP